MNVFSLIGKAAGWLFGTSSGSESPASTIAKTIDEYKYTDEEKAESDVKDLESARTYKPEPMPTIAPIQQRGLILFLFEFVLRLINQGVDALNHAIRPGVLLWLIGGFSSWWKLPDPGLIDPEWMRVFYIVLTFWFGGRTLIKDLPAAIGAIRNLRK